MKKTARGFTLIELLVVIAIIAILAAVMMITLQPLQFLMRGRDATRLADLATLSQAINLAMSESSESASTLACNGATGDCTDTSILGTPANRAINGTGWVKVNFKGQSAISIPVLPIDPSNGATYHYTYCGNGSNWMIKGILESDQYKVKMTSDGDTDDLHYAVGGDMTMSCTY